MSTPTPPAWPWFDRSPKGLPAYLVQAVILGVAYYIAAFLSLRLALVRGQVTPIWPPTGIALVGLLLLGRRAWPAISVAAFLVNLPLGPSPLTASIIALGDTLAPVLAATMLAGVGFRPELNRLRDAVALVVLGAFVAMFVSATIGAGVLVRSGAVPVDRFWPTWWVWWTGDAMGILIAAPFLLSLIRPHGRLGRPWPTLAEAMAILLGTAFAAYVAFHSELEMEYLVFPFLGFAAWRFGLRVAAPAALVASLMAILAAVHRTGPFAEGTVDRRMAILQLFNGSVAFVSLTVSALVAERRRAVAERIDAERQYRELFDNAVDGFFKTSVDGRFVAANRALARMLGYGSAEELIGSVGDVARLDADGTDHGRSERALEAQRTVVGHEYRVRRRDGTTIWVSENASPVRDPAGALIGFDGTMVDITERKTAEENLRRAFEAEQEATRQLRALDEMKNWFLTAVSHELRTPLSVVLGNSLTLERLGDSLDDAERESLLHATSANAQKLTKLLSDLLDLDRLTRGNLSPDLRDVELGALVRRTIEGMGETASRITFDMPTVTIPADASLIERIVENLVGNALRHTPAGTQIWVGIIEDEGGVTLTVQDSGPGVPAGLREAIFEPFRQVTDRPSASPGIGIGLTLVTKFAEVHGGRVWVEERPGGGACFRVYIPAVAAVGTRSGGS